MNNKNETSIKILSFIGIATWVGAIFIRDTSLMSIPPINFLAGIAPNFGAFLIFAFIVETFFHNKLKKNFHKKPLIITLGTIFLLAFTSEIFHHFFLNSPFDIWDMYASTLAMVLYYIVSSRATKKNKIIIKN